jgi:hypothetical protein
MLARQAIYVQNNNNCLHFCLSYPAWTGQEPYRIALRGLSDSTTFSTLSHKLNDFRLKKLLNTNCVLWFSLKLLSETLVTGPSILVYILIENQQMHQNDNIIVMSSQTLPEDGNVMPKHVGATIHN